VRALGEVLALGEVREPVAPHVPLVRAPGVHFVKDAAQPPEVLQLEVRVRLRASACCPQSRSQAPQQSAPALRPSRVRPWSLAR
jgi:hypothetical protein